jgi:hypothetical protein
MLGEDREPGLIAAPVAVPLDPLDLDPPDAALAGGGRRRRRGIPSRRPALQGRLERSVNLRLCSTRVYNVTLGWVDHGPWAVDGRPISIRRAFPLARYLQSSNPSN